MPILLESIKKKSLYPITRSIENPPNSCWTTLNDSVTSACLKDSITVNFKSASNYKNFVRIFALKLVILKISKTKLGWYCILFICGMGFQYTLVYYSSIWFLNHIQGLKSFHIFQKDFESTSNPKIP